MSAWAAKRQRMIIGGVLTVVLVVLLLLGFKLFVNEPTCTDGKQNGNETGVDVGGDCPIADPALARDIEVLWVRPFFIADDVYSTIAYIENPNPNLSAARVPYRFRLYDDRNVLIAERRGETFVAANQRTAIIETALKVGNRNPANVFFEFLQQPVWQETDVALTGRPLTIARQELTRASTSPLLTVTIENETTQPMSAFDVIAILYGVNGNALTTSKTYVANLPARATQELYFTWPEPILEDVARIEVIPRINPFAQQ